MLEEKPSGTITFPPEGGDRYKVRTGDSWDSIARVNNLSTWALIEFNFPVVKGEANFQKKCRMVNWLLRNYVGCTHSPDGKNYRFDGNDNPGVIYVPLFDTPPTYTHRVRLHFRSLTMTAVPFDRLFRATQRAYAPHGMRIDFVSGLSLGLTDDEAARLSTVNGKCEWDITSGDFAEVLRLGGSVPSADVTVYFIGRFSENINGCGGHLPGKPACLVAAAAAQYSPAHEVCHVLLGSSFSPIHESSTTNLMYHSESWTADPPGLSDQQVAQIKRSICCAAL